MFTIQVSKPVNEDFDAEQLEMRHGECGGGKINLRFDSSNSRWDLTCFRCHVGTYVVVSTSGSSAIAMTALDGKRRTIEKYSESCDDIVAEQSA
ncbi:MAG: hypothetical protein FJ266_16965 [Planctomycetes bacterium]|nr:hypothetical protein [Planctomycetota bacterium]